MAFEHDTIPTGPRNPVVFVTTVEGPPEKVARAAELVRGQLMAVYRDQPGWQGALGLLSLDHRRSLVVSFWESESALLESGASVARFREGAASLGVTIVGSQRLEIVFDERVE